MWEHVKVGMTVIRSFDGQTGMPLKVTAVDDKFIHCGPWKFDIRHGGEVDEDLGWPAIEGDCIITGSYISAIDGEQ